MSTGESDDRLDVTGVIAKDALESNETRELEALPAPTTARLFCIAGSAGDVGSRFALDPTRPTSIGRGTDVHIKLHGDEVSRRHAEVRPRAGRFAIVDLDARNGTTVNDVVLTANTERLLAPGDRIRLGGGTTLVFEAHNELEDRAQRLHELDLMAMVTAGIVHDFKNTLMVVLANAEMMREVFVDRGEDSADLREMADDILVAARRGLECSERLLYFARRQTGNATPKAQVPLDALIDDVVAMVRGPLSKARIKLETALSADAILVGSRYELHHALLNLVLNARDAMPDGGSLTIRTRPLSLTRSDALRLHVRESTSGYVEVVVEDTGSGMDEATQAHLFEPYFTTKGSGGTGLGLPSVFGVVRNHGGNVLVESAPGRGTRFRLVLPLA